MKITSAECAEHLQRGACHEAGTKSVSAPASGVMVTKDHFRWATRQYHSSLQAVCKPHAGVITSETENHS